MSHYARNHLQDNWDAYDQAEYATRVTAANEDANEYFKKATTQQKAEFDAVMMSLLGVTGPAADRARRAARTKWYADTVEARELQELTVSCLLQTGEVSSDLDALWTALIDAKPVFDDIEAALRVAMAAAE